LNGKKGVQYENPPLQVYLPVALILLLPRQSLGDATLSLYGTFNSMGVIVNINHQMTRIRMQQWMSNTNSFRVVLSKRVSTLKGFC
jgi:hypothetical protein